MAKYQQFEITTFPTLNSEVSLPTLIKSEDITKEQFYELCKILCPTLEGAKLISSGHLGVYITVYQGKYGFNPTPKSTLYYILTPKILEDFLEKHSLFNISLEDFIQDQIS